MAKSRFLKNQKSTAQQISFAKKLTIFAWTGALRKRGELDGIEELSSFADKLEKACVKTIEDGKMTKDLALITSIDNPKVLNSRDFILAIRETLEQML